MTAGLATVRYLSKHSGTIYPKLDQDGKTLRDGVDKALGEAGIEANSTGLGSLFLTHFGRTPRNAEEASMDNFQLEKNYAMHLMSKGLFRLPGHLGAVSTAHTSQDIRALIQQTKVFGESAARMRK
jgi:glutamate-1-semialdehyde 2,1-aminomutase